MKFEKIYGVDDYDDDIFVLWCGAPCNMMGTY